MVDQYKNKRIFIGTTEIAGYYRNLSRGLTELGVNFKYVQLSPNTSGFGSESKLPFLVRLPYPLALKRLKISVEPGLYSVHKTKGGIKGLLRFIFYINEGLLRTFIVLPWAIFNFDIFCFGARSNIVGIKAGYWDIKLLKFLGKRIIYIYHGSDGRPPYINGSLLHNLLSKYPNWESELKKLTKKTNIAVSTIENLADIVIDNPYSAHFQCKPFVNWFNIGAPFYPSNYSIQLNYPSSKNRLIRILHAPTHRVAKGSAIIEEVIQKLKNENHPVELVMVHGRPHRDVIEEINRCDFVIDELYSDALMAGLAAEASYYAKPVIACGYVEDEHLKKMIPTYYCRPEELENAVIKFINEPEFRIALGKRAQEFVQSEWACINIARRFMRVAEGDIPKNWLVNPKSIDYLHGFGLTEALLKKIMRSFIKKYGLSVLYLDDKPDLRDAFLEFSEVVRLSDK